MLANAGMLARFDLLHSLRQRETWVWTFLMPIVFFFFFSKMVGSGGAGGPREEPLRLQLGADAGTLVEALERRLSEQGYAVERVDTDAAAGEAPQVRTLVVPPDLTARVLAGERTALTLRRDAGGLSADYDDFRVGRAVYTVLADLVALRARGEQPTAEAFEALQSAPRALTLEVRPAGRRKQVPSGLEQSIPGTLTMFTLIVLLTSGCVPIVIERRAGLLRRLASAPIARGEVVAGRWLSTFGLGLVQVAWAMAVGTLLFGMDWGPEVAAVVLVLVAWVALCASLALTLGVLARTESQVIGIGVLSANVLAALGGCWWPIEIAPGWMQALARWLPTGWVMDALHRLISFQAAPAQVVPHVLGMAAFALAVGWLGARRFRYA